MRRILVAGLVPVILVVLAACQPTPVTLTANPSTLKPACNALTTVTGKVTPKDSIKEADLEYQRSDGKWLPWKWVETTVGSETLHFIIATIKPDGTYSFTYRAPSNIHQATTRLRLHGTYRAKDVDVVSKSWYVTKPTGC